MAIERKVYQCEHCKKFRKKPRIFFDKGYARQHERGCLYNLDVKSCFTCKHNKPEYVFEREFTKAKRGNKCKIGQNWHYNNHIEYCNKPKDESGLDPICTEQDFYLFPITMQIVWNCPHWEYIYQAEDGESDGN